MMIGWMAKNERSGSYFATVLAAICSLAEMVKVRQLLELPAGETIGQWGCGLGKAVVGFDRLYHCFLFATTSRKSFLDRYFVFPEFLCSCGLEPSIVRGN
ncbi:MAG: hypothetical protein ACLVEU_13625 [Bacteroides cellulosilyticus]